MALYHKHRPQTFDTVIHQEHIVTTLKNELTSGKIAHAYLFSGPHGVGKTTTARILAKSLNCTNRKPEDSNPCDTCDSCRDITSSRSIDVLEIDAASQTGVDNVRENIIENAQFKPTRGKYKIFIVDEVHMLSTAAFNALLKTLEEPPAHVVFILATTDAQKLPATVISRCQRFTFARVPDETLKKHLSSIAALEGVTIDDDVLGAVVRKARGGARDAVSLLDQLIAIGETHITATSASFVMPTTSNETQINFLSHVVEKNTVAALEDINGLREQGTYPHIFMDEIIQLLRLLLISSVDAHLAKKESYLPDSDNETILTLTKKISQKEIVALTDRAIARMNEIKSAPLPYLPLELLVVEWSSGEQAPVAVTPARPVAVPVAPTAPTLPVVPKPSTPPPITPTVAPEPAVVVVATPPAVVEIEASTPASTSSPVPTTVDMSAVKKAWGTLITELEKSTPSLIFILKNATLELVEHDTLKIRVAYSFHQDKIMQTGNKKKIEDGLEKHLGYRLGLEATIDETMQQKNPTSDLTDLATALGGSVI